MKNRIYFYANFGDLNKPPYGGGEAGNRKTLELFDKIGVETVMIPKFKHIDGSGLFVNLVKLWFSFACMVRYTITLTFGRRSGSVVHIAGYYVKRIEYEKTLLRIAKLLGYKVTYEMRAGGAIEKYNTFGSKYRKGFDYIIKHADHIFSQGLENIPLIKQIDSNAKIYYYPNYVMSDFYPVVYPIKEQGNINFIYFGRLSKKKNVHVILEAFEIISAKFACTTLTLVGNFADDNYQKKIESMIEQSLFRDRIFIRPACSRGELKEYLKDKHFYLFPSNEVGEGHSNALTEAMAWGLIPIASPQGFNRGVIGIKDLVVDNIEAEDFADHVIRIIERNEIEKYSKYVYERVQELYTDKQALSRIKEEYEKIFKELHEA